MAMLTAFPMGMGVDSQLKPRYYAMRYPSWQLAFAHP
jgi:hypothetical protein